MPVHYNTARRYSGGSSLAEVDPKPHNPSSGSNLGLGVQRLRDENSHHKTRVGQFNERDCPPIGLPSIGKSNAPYIQRQNYVRDGHGNRNPGNGQLVDTGSADTSGSRPNFAPIRLPAVSLSARKDSIGLSMGRGQGNLRCPIVLTYGEE